MARGGNRRRWLRWAAIALGVAVLGCVVTGLVLHRPRPEGGEGEAADALARRMQQAVELEAWERTGAVQWTFAGSREHLWDRERGLTRVRWDEHEVLLRPGDRSGRAFTDGREVKGEARRELLDEAHAAWTNDAFWLNPLPKLFDPGVRRELVERDGDSEALLVTFTSGGRTPGDSYLWIPDTNGKPKAWRMWVSILPIGGLRTSWEGWKELETGALVATRHTFGPISLELTDVRGAESLEALAPDDPFAPLE